MKRSLALFIMLLGAPGFAAAQAGIITTFAGGGVGDGGPALQAALNATYGAAVDSAGNIYTVSAEQGRVRKIDAVTGIITTVAGTGFRSYNGDGIPATSANLNEPWDVAVDAMGNVFIAESQGKRVRRVDAATGLITTIAGTGSFDDLYSGDGGPATSAGIGYAQGVAVGLNGDVYIVVSQRIRKVSAATGIITTIAGTGTYNPSAFGENGPAVNATVAAFRIAVDAAGTVFFTDLAFNRIRKVTGGIITTVAGNGQYDSTGDGGSALSAALVPYELALDNQHNVLFYDQRGARVRKVSASTGIITNVAGTGVYVNSGDGGPAASAAVRNILGIAVNAAGDIFLADSADYRVRRIDAATGIIDLYAGNGERGFGGDGGPASASTMLAPMRTAADAAGNILIADSGNNRVRKVNAATGVITTIAGSHAPSDAYPLFKGDGGPATDAWLNNPRGVASDAAGNVYIADSSNNLIRKVDGPTGVITTVINSPNWQDGRDPGGVLDPFMQGPDVIALDAAGRLYISEYARIARFDPATGSLTTVAGREDWVTGFDGDGGPAVGATLYNPFGIAFDAAGNMFFSDTWNYRIRRVDAVTGIITTVAGDGTGFAPDGTQFAGDGGDALQAVTSGVFGISMNAAGHLFLADTFNHRVRRVDAATGIITTVAGNGSDQTSGDGGDALNAGVDYPIDVLARGNTLYITNGSLNNRVRKVELPFSKSTPTLTWNTPAPITVGTPLGAAQLNATARIPGTFSYSPAAGATPGLGTQTLSVTFTPADPVNFNGNTATVSISVTKADTAMLLTSSANPSTAGQAVTFTATVVGFITPTGTVTFKDGATTIGSGALAANGKATLTIATLSTGSHSITAAYGGSTTFNTSTSAPVTQTVQPAGNTPPGAGVPVAPIDATTGGPSPITLTFSNVTSSGTTTVTSSPGGLPPTGYLVLGTPPKVYDITTTAHYSGTIQVCIAFTGGGHPKLFHDGGTGWTDITTGYPSPGVVCGSTTSLSPFALFVSVTQQLIDVLTDAINASNLKAQTKAALIAAVQKIPVKLSKLTPLQRVIELLKVDAAIVLVNQLLAHHDIDPGRANGWLTILRAIDAALRAS